MPQITPIAVGFDRLFGSKHPPIPTTLAHMSALATLEKCCIGKRSLITEGGDASAFI
jgi:hypothetical protein